MKKCKTIALVAHDNLKRDLIEWVRFNKGTLIRHRIVCTGTTGRLVEEALKEDMDNDPDCRIATPQLDILKLKSGPLGGDQQLGSMIAEGKIDVLIFLWDPMQPQPHDVDVRSLLRISNLYNIPTAANRATADFIISSPLFGEEYVPVLKDFSEYLQRALK